MHTHTHTHTHTRHATHTEQIDLHRNFCQVHGADRGIPREQIKTKHLHLLHARLHGNAHVLPIFFGVYPDARVNLLTVCVCVCVYHCVLSVYTSTRARN